MQAVILAGGLATRLRPVTEKVAKAMVDIHGKPFLDYQLRLLKKNGIDDVVLCVGYLADQIRGHFNDGKALGMRIHYSEDGPTLMGTAGALRIAEPLLANHFFVLDGDAYLPLDYRAIMEAYEKSGREALMVVFENHNRYDQSNAAIEDGRVTAYDRSGKISGLVHIHAGISVLSKKCLKKIPKDRPSAQDELWSDLISRGELAAFAAPHRFYEVGSMAGLEEFRRSHGDCAPDK